MTNSLSMTPLQAFDLYKELWRSLNDRVTDDTVRRELAIAFVEVVVKRTELLGFLEVADDAAELGELDAGLVAVIEDWSAKRAARIRPRQHLTAINAKPGTVLRKKTRLQKQLRRTRSGTFWQATGSDAPFVIVKLFHE